MTLHHLASLSIGLGLLLCAAAPQPVAAQLPIARLSALFPPGGKAGTTVDVTAQGADLDEPSRLIFSHAGIVTAPNPDGTRFKVTIASDVPPGSYEARFAGRFGLSNPRRFVVGPWPEEIAASTNTAQSSALEVRANIVVNARLSPTTFAWYKFAAKKSQRFFVECLAEPIDSRLDPTLVISDADGREWERSRTGGLLDFTAPADGTYFLRLADLLYRGGDDYFYRLTLASRPQIDYILPMAGAAGTKTNFTLYGRALPGGKPVKGLMVDGKPLEQVSVSIALPGSPEKRVASRLPSSGGLDTFEYRFKGSNPVLIQLTDGPAPFLLEHEPNSIPAQAQRITPPCEISGQFHPAADVDRFLFDAKKGDVFRLEVVSQRLGLPTGPALLVQRITRNEKGEERTSDVLELLDNDTNLGEREFITTSRDPSGRFEAKEDGTYRIELRDLFNPASASPRNTYHLSIRRESPDFRLVAQAVAPKYKADAKNVEVGVPVLRRGETLPIRVMAFRRDGFNGDIELALENPPPGLGFVTDRLESGKNSDWFLLTASADAPAFAGPIRLVGKARIGDRDVRRRARGGTVIAPIGNYDSERADSRVTGEFTLAILDRESAPIAIAPAENRTWEAPASGKLEIPLSVMRRADFNANLKLKPLGPGAADGLKEFEVDGKATNAVLKLDFAALKLGPGDYVFAVQALTTGKYRNNPEAAAFAEAAAKEADKLAGEAVAEAKKSGDDLERRKKELTAAETGLAAAAEKLAAAKAAADKSPADEKLAEERAAAEKAHEAAVGLARMAGDALATAETTRMSAEAKVKEMQARKESTAKRSKELNDKAKPRDVSYQLTSVAVPVRVTPPVVVEAKEKDSKQASK